MSTGERVVIDWRHQFVGLGVLLSLQRQLEAARKVARLAVVVGDAPKLIADASTLVKPVRDHLPVGGGGRKWPGFPVCSMACASTTRASSERVVAGLCHFGSALDSGLTVPAGTPSAALQRLGALGNQHVAHVRRACGSGRHPWSCRHSHRSFGRHRSMARCSLARSTPTLAATGRSSLCGHYVHAADAAMHRRTRTGRPDPVILRTLRSAISPTPSMPVCTAMTSAALRTVPALECVPSGERTGRARSACTGARTDAVRRRSIPWPWCA
jgi:hypothetical protein